jgi:hypothetical protein
MNTLQFNNQNPLNRMMPPVSATNPLTVNTQILKTPPNMGTLNMNSGSVSQTTPNAPGPQIQHQLIESFRLAVQSGLISSDLLNTKLPADVLTNLYQLFQVGFYLAGETVLTTLKKAKYLSV